MQEIENEITFTPPLDKKKVTDFITDCPDFIYKVKIYTRKQKEGD
ncbi:hypothetical protein LCGC14_1443970 [marine sediment metagenome]|uniref:Uncharacterized protein n=1 Tax=marine sediment metagenome TaxID=412755 RepID=A0A0F9M083_9ZZZZ